MEKPNRPSSTPYSTGLSARLAARNGTHTSLTSDLAPTHLQANLLVLPSRYATDFRLLCSRNPVPCPLLSEGTAPGQWSKLKSCINGHPDDGIAADIDIRKDAPRYNVYQDAQLVKSGCVDIVDEWTDDHVAFLIGCSFSFESALSEAGLPPRHSTMNRNVPMYRTNIPLCPAGVFTGSTVVVSLRPYRKDEVNRVRDITRPYSATHGEPIAWGWDALHKLGIQDIDKPDWGDAPFTLGGRPLSEVNGDDENMPVLWGCGVTPQEAVMRAKLQGTVMGHAPGHMICLDIRDWDIIQNN